MIKTIVAAIIIASAATLAMAQDKATNCAAPETDEQATECATADFDKADKELNAVYKTLMATKTEEDKEAAAENSPYGGQVDALKKSQRAWIYFRDAQCSLVGLQFAGGTIQPTMETTCQADLTKARTSELQKLSEGL